MLTAALKAYIRNSSEFDKGQNISLAEIWGVFTVEQIVPTGHV
jgi:hypothetical protein